MKYSYNVCGITIATDIHFPLLAEKAGEPEILLRYGEVPDALNGNLVNFPFVEANSSAYLLKLTGIARYLATATGITVQPETGADLQTVNHYVLTVVLAAASYLRGFVPIHGGAALINGKAVLFTGPSGVGKSALLAALHQKGFEIVADDLCNLTFRDGACYLHRGLPFLQLWKDMCYENGLDNVKSVKLRSDLEKYIVPLGTETASEPVKVSGIFNLVSSGPTPYLFKGIGKADMLVANLFQPWMAEILSPGRSYFKQLFLIAPHILAGNVFYNRSQSPTLLADGVLDQIRDAK